MSIPDGSHTGPDLAAGIASAELAEGGMLVGYVGDQAVMLAKSGGAVFAVGALCTHYHAPLVEGLLVGATVRCPWHHARFCLKTGAAIGAPAVDPLPAWRVEARDDRLFVLDRLKATQPAVRRSIERSLRRIVIVGGGAGGFAAAEMLRREGFDGSLTVLSADEEPPYDRPNLSKDYLAGKAPRDWMPLKDKSFYELAGIDLKTGVEAASVETRDRRVVLTTGERLPYDALILATGASPIRPPLPGFDNHRSHVLRSLADCESIIRAAEGASKVVILGASFIGLEVAAALVERGLEVHVAAPEAIPLERILGGELGRFVRSVHEKKGVVFHLGHAARAFENGAVILDDGAALPADFLVVGVGVKPRTRLASAAGLTVDDGIVVGSRLETSVAGVFAVGDAARYPDHRTGELIRVEHWVAAERQGQHAARVLLGLADVFKDTPFFWSSHHNVTINYVGHASAFDVADVEGSIEAADATVRYSKGGRVLAAATLGRDRESLALEVAMEPADATD